MTNDEAMGRALALAQQAAAEGDVPVGAVVLDAEGRVIGEGRNRREDDGDPLAHAEVLAMRQAAADARRAWNLADCTLVVTLEPCPMCAGACLQTHYRAHRVRARGTPSWAPAARCGTFRAIRTSAIAPRSSAVSGRGSARPFWGSFLRAVAEGGSHYLAVSDGEG